MDTGDISIFGLVIFTYDVYFWLSVNVYIVCLRCLYVFKNRLSLKQGTGDQGMGTGNGNLRGMTGESSGNHRRICGE